jgi:hypothetical protein
VVVLLEDLGNALALPTLSLTDQSTHKPRLDVVVAFGDQDSEGILLFVREVLLATLLVDQALLVYKDLIRKAVAS